MQKVKKQYIIHRNMSLKTAEVQEHHFKMEGRELLKDIPTEGNVRDALKKKTAVYRAMVQTIEDRPEDFHILNGGVTIVVDDLDVDNASNTVAMVNPNIVNGAQTQKALGDSREMVAQKSTPVSVKVLVAQNPETKADISIALNNQTPVKMVSMLGVQKMLDELEIAIQRDILGFRLDKKESDEAYVDRSGVKIPITRIVQLLFLALPENMQIGKNYHPRRTYAGTTKWLKQFADIWNIVHKEDYTEDDDLKLRAKHAYSFFLKNAGTVIKLYEMWKKDHPLYTKYDHNCGLFKPLTARAKKNIETAPRIMHDGVLFPLLYSVYAWHCERCKSTMSDKMSENLIASIYEMLEEQNGDPQKMGKAPSPYGQIKRYNITNI